MEKTLKVSLDVPSHLRVGGSLSFNCLSQGFCPCPRIQGNWAAEPQGQRLAGPGPADSGAGAGGRPAGSGFDGWGAETAGWRTAGMLDSGTAGTAKWHRCP